MNLPMLMAMAMTAGAGALDVPVLRRLEPLDRHDKDRVRSPSVAARRAKNKLARAARKKNRR